MGLRDGAFFSMAKEKPLPIIKWWKNKTQLEDWYYDVFASVNSNLDTTQTYKKRRLKELEIYKNELDGYD